MRFCITPLMPSYFFHDNEHVLAERPPTRFPGPRASLWAFVHAFPLSGLLLPFFYYLENYRLRPNKTSPPSFQDLLQVKSYSSFNLLSPGFIETSRLVLIWCNSPSHRVGICRGEGLGESSFSLTSSPTPRTSYAEWLPVLSPRQPLPLAGEVFRGDVLSRDLSQPHPFLSWWHSASTLAVSQECSVDLLFPFLVQTVTWLLMRMLHFIMLVNILHLQRPPNLTNVLSYDSHLRAWDSCQQVCTGVSHSPPEKQYFFSSCLVLKVFTRDT